MIWPCWSTHVLHKLLTPHLIIIFLYFMRMRVRMRMRMRIRMRMRMRMRMGLYSKSFHQENLKHVIKLTEDCEQWRRIEILLSFLSSLTKYKYGGRRVEQHPFTTPSPYTFNTTKNPPSPRDLKKAFDIIICHFARGRGVYNPNVRWEM